MPNKRALRVKGEEMKISEKEGDSKKGIEGRSEKRKEEAKREEGV
jgi:hypothetical protein